MPKPIQGPERVPMLSLEEARSAAEAAGLPEVFASLSVFRILLRDPELASAIAGQLQHLLRGKHFDGRLRELVILRIGWATGSVYEWTQHWRVARLMEIREDDLLGVRDWRNHADFGHAERAVLAATDETLEHGVIGEETWRACESALGSIEARLEMVVAIGNWQLFSSLLRSLNVPLEEGVEPWPPDGLAPQLQ